MNEQERQRLAFLSAGPCVPTDYIDEYYGLPWPLSGDDNVLRQDFDAWRTRLRRRAECRDGDVNRYELEAFMHQKEVMPKKWMAARLGMTEDSLNKVFKCLPNLQMRPQRYNVYDCLIANSLYDDLAPNLPGLRFVVFSDEGAFCRRLHAELTKTLSIDVQPLFCETSERLGEEPRQFARDFDCITLKPLSAKHQLWLDFRKPLNLPPDRCSKLLYAENQEALRSHCFGKLDPEDLEEYIHAPLEQASG
jgi:hypothetical protein